MARLIKCPKCLHEDPVEIKTLGAHVAFRCRKCGAVGEFAETAAEALRKWHERYLGMMSPKGRSQLEKQLVTNIDRIEKD